MKQIFFTVAMGKRLIGKAVAVHPAVTTALHNGTVVVIAGTTNGYIAEEILNTLGQNTTFSRSRFLRGVNLPPGYKVSATGRLSEETKFPGDLIINKGVVETGKTIDEVASNLKEGDVIVKGANALDIKHKRAAVLIGNPQGGTIVYGLVNGATSEAAAMSKVLRIVHTDCGERPQVGKVFKLRGAKGGEKTDVSR